MMRAVMRDDPVNLGSGRSRSSSSGRAFCDDANERGTVVRRSEPDHRPLLYFLAHYESSAAITKINRERSTGISGNEIRRVVRGTRQDRMWRLRVRKRMDGPLRKARGAAQI
jgi:hypothetical protein